MNNNLSDFNFDFIDFGCSQGGSIRACEKLFGGKGLGIDLDAKKVRAARKSGLMAVEMSFDDFSDSTSCRFVSMCDFLEHLPDFATAERAVRQAASIAEEFIYIRHPSFEDEPYLRALGLKQYWHDWSGHPSHLMLSDLVAWLSDAGFGCLQLEFYGPILDSSDSSIVPASAPTNSHAYDDDLHEPKPFVKFSRTLFRQIRILAHRSESSKK